MAAKAIHVASAPRPRLRPAVEPLPLEPIHQHAERACETLYRWFCTHADLTSADGLSSEAVGGWLQLHDAIVGLLDCVEGLMMAAGIEV